MYSLQWERYRERSSMQGALELQSSSPETNTDEVVRAKSTGFNKGLLIHGTHGIGDIQS